MKKTPKILKLKEYDIGTRCLSKAMSIAQLPEKFVKPSKEELKRMYIDEKMSANKIGKSLGKSQQTIIRWLKKHGIGMRDTSEAASIALLPEGFVKPTKEELEEMYVHDGMSTAKIGERLGISNATVFRLLRKDNIKTRGAEHLPEGFVKPTKEELEKMYIYQKCSTYNIAKRLSVCNTSVIKWLRKYNIPIRSNKPISNSQFQDFLKNNQPALNLAGASVILNGQGSDAERIILELYQGKFKDSQQLHNLINENKEGIYKIIREGLTNLGIYIGNFSLEERTIIPILIGQAISDFRHGEITHSIEDKIIHILRSQYSPAFNDNPEETISRLEKTIEQYNGKVRDIYQKLYNHYQEVLQLQEELK